MQRIPEERARRLANEPIPSLLLAFSLPAMLGMLSQGIYTFVDRVFVGHALGEPGLAAFAIIFPYMLMLLACGMLIGVGTSARISLCLGEGRKDEAERVLGNCVPMMIGLSLVLTVAGYYYLTPIVNLLAANDPNNQADPQVLLYATQYLRIIVLGTVFQIVGFGLNAAIRGEGNPRTAMITMLVSVLINIALAPIFIFVFHWGMRGAAFATLAAQAAAATWVVLYFVSGKSLLKIRAKNLRFNPRVSGLILAIGAPLFAMQLAGAFMNVMLNHQLKTFGALMGPGGATAAISIMGVIYPLLMLFGMPIFGLSQATQPIIGYNYGARQFDRAKKALTTAILAATAIGGLGFFVAMVFPTQVFHMFAFKYETMIAVGTHAMRMSLCTMVFIGFQVLGGSYFQAVGKPKEAMLLMLSRQVFFLIPALLILPKYLGLDGVWLAIPTADVCSTLLTAVCLRIELRRLDDQHIEATEAAAAMADAIQNPVPLDSLSMAEDVL